MDTEKMFELADRLRALRDEKAEVEQYLKEIKAEMDEVDYRLSELMAESETQNFTRSGTMFCLTTKTHASAVAGRKEELFSALRAGGFGDLVYETVNANSLSAFVKEQVAENGDMLPDWLDVPVAGGRAVPADPFPAHRLDAGIFPLHQAPAQ